MRVLVLKARVKPNRFQDLVELSKTLEETDLSLFLRDLQTIKDGPWQKCNYVFTLPGLTPEVWNRYDVLGIKDLREQKMLNTELPHLYNAFKEFYRTWSKYLKNK